MTLIDITDANSPSITEIPEISDQKKGVPILGTLLWCSHRPSRVYSNSQRSPTPSSSQKPQNPSDSGGLASLVTFKRAMSVKFPKIGQTGTRTGLAHQYKKIRIGTR